jgi:two-component system, OmpR family, sensor kinase
MAKLSIRRRLIASVFATQLILTIALVALATYFTRGQLRAAFDAALHGRAMSVAALIRYSEEGNHELVFDAELSPPPLDRHHPDLYQIVDENGHVIGASSNWPTDFSGKPMANRQYWDANVDGVHYRIVRMDHLPVLDREGPDTASTATITVIYAAPTDEFRENLWHAAILTSIGSLVLLGVATLVAAWAIRQGLSPLATLATSAGRVSPSDWNLNLPADATATEELAPLTRAMETMLATLYRAFTSQQEFLANAAHELKTPVAILKSTLQSMVQVPRTAEEYRLRIEVALEDVARIEKLIHSMLRLARAEQSAARHHRQDLAAIDLAVSCEQSADRLGAFAATGGVAIEVRVETRPTIKADPEDLELIWNNLLENAIRYSPKSSRVVVTISEHDHRAQVKVEDWGSGIAENELAHIFERFHRADVSRTRETGGYGLGLAITKAMVDAYGGTIVAQSRVGEGTAMTVRLPLDS